jgi:hypothetical protein
MCVGRDPKRADYLFRPHQNGLEDAVGPEGNLFVITMPVTAVLKNLEQMNISPFSLFESEDSLVWAIARTP